MRLLVMRLAEPDNIQGAAVVRVMSDSTNATYLAWQLFKPAITNCITDCYVCLSTIREAD